MLPKIGKRLMNSLTTRVARPQATQRPNDCVYPIRRIAQHLTQRLHAFLGLGRSLPIGGSKRVTKMRSGMLEIEDLFTNWQRLGKIAPVVWRSIGDFDD